ncbi:DUF2167 domain-containing protein [Haloferula sargassicola]|uniref:DUF2167 domain-containing protein n=1 Tax=Haloferula sargassicola TaxID=490096 RepID=A0ABP9UUT7_9BACT
MTLRPFLLFPVLGFAALAQEPEHEMTLAERQQAYSAYVHELLGEDPYQTGDVELPGGLAALHLPAGYRFLPEEGAKKVVVDLWGNPPESVEDTLGLIVPAEEELDQFDSWAVVVEFEEEGYVSDHDADEIDYDELLSQMKEGASAANAERTAAGYPAVDIVGWAIPPHYDKSHKVLHWAKDVHFSDAEDDTLNYDVRVLGRRGILNLQAVASMSNLAEIQDVSPLLTGMVEFLPGHRYADYDPKTDKKSELSLAGMIVGGAVAAKLAAKAGILAKLGIVLAKGWKAIAIGAVALGGMFKKLVRRQA